MPIKIEKTGQCRTSWISSKSCLFSRSVSPSYLVSHTLYYSNYYHHKSKPFTSSCVELGHLACTSASLCRSGIMGMRSSLSITNVLLDNRLSSNMDDLAGESRNLGRHLAEMVVLGSTSVSILRWLASIAAIYLLILDRTNWRTNILTALLVPYIFLNLPSIIFNLFRGEIGRWIAFVAIVLRLFFPRHFPDWLELPGALILLLVAAPSLLADDLRSSLIGYIISLIIGVYLLQEHIRAAGGFRKAFSERHGISNTIGIILLFVSPLWELIRYFL